MTENVTHSFRVRVYYEDVDLGGIVYHSKYLNFCERARSEVFFADGSSPVQGDYHFVVKHIDADFIASGKFGEVLEVRTQLVSSKRASFILQQDVVEANSENRLYSMQVHLVCMKGQKVAPMPEGFVERFR